MDEMSVQAATNYSGTWGRRLPLEVVCCVLELLDKPALAACSLIARSWLDIARSYLFRTIKYCAKAAPLIPGLVQPWTHPSLHTVLDFLKVSDPPALRDFLKTLDATPAPLQDLLGFLNATPSVRLHIRALSLTMPPAEGFTGDYYGYSRRGQLDTLYAILQHTQSLQTLEIHHFRFVDRATASSLPPIPNTPAIESLKYFHINEIWPGIDGEDYTFQLLRFVGDVDRLRYIPHFRFINRPEREPPVAWPPHSPKKLGELSIHSIRALSCLPPIHLSELRSFSIDDLRLNDFLQMAEFLAALGQNLRRLQFSLYVDWTLGVQRAGRRTLAVLTKLESLYLILSVYAPAASVTNNLGSLAFYSPVYNFIIRALSTTSENLRHLRSITFQLKLTDVPHFVDNWATVFHSDPVMLMDWCELDHLLVQRITAESGCAVNFILEGFEDIPIARHCVKVALPRTRATGALQFPSTDN